MQRRYLSIYFTPNKASNLTLQLGSLLNFCKRYTPLVSLDEPRGIMLDITGCAHLFKGERSLMAQVGKDFKELGHIVQIAICPTPRSARAMARFKKDTIIQALDMPHALYGLPIEALEVDHKIETTLHELGVKIMLELFRLPRAQLLSRFGNAILNRIDEIRGNKEDPRFYIPDVRDWKVEDHLLHAARDSSFLNETIFKNLKKLCHKLSCEGIGLKTLTLTLVDANRQIQDIDVSLSHPSFDAKKIFKLLLLKLDDLDGGLGIETIKLCASETQRVSCDTISLTGEISANQKELSELLDTLTNKIGSRSVFQFAFSQSYIPEKSFTYKNDIDVKGKEHTLEVTRLYPTRLLKKPEPIDVIAMLPDSPPRKIVWRNRFVFNVTKADGPERIEPEWWSQQETDLRDYYCVENSTGLRLWVFKQAAKNHVFSRWYLHGFFS